MTTKIISISNQKGGCGKTTIAMNLAGYYGMKNKVFVVDGDSQGTATKWSAMAGKDKPFAATVANLSHAGSQAHHEIEKLTKVYDIIIPFPLIKYTNMNMHMCF